MDFWTELKLLLLKSIIHTFKAYETEVYKVWDFIERFGKRNTREKHGIMFDSYLIISGLDITIHKIGKWKCIQRLHVSILALRTLIMYQILIHGMEIAERELKFDRHHWIANIPYCKHHLLQTFSTTNITILLKSLHGYSRLLILQAQRIISIGCDFSSWYIHQRQRPTFITIYPVQPTIDYYNGAKWVIGGRLN